MAPDPPRVGDECLSSMNSDFLIVTNSDESDGDFNDIENSIDDYMQTQGYTLFTDDVNDPSYHHNSSSLFDDEDSEQYDSDGNSIEQQPQSEIRTADSNCTEPVSSVAQEIDNCQTEEEGAFLNRSNSNSEANGSSCARCNIKIDCNQVKAAMKGFTLPPSAIPPWAIGVTDQDITSHVNKLLSNIDKNK